MAGTPGAIRQVPTDAGIAGQGRSYPPSYNSQGRMNISYGPTLVEQALQSIWQTSPGDRAMLPKYGAAVGEFEPVDEFRMIARFKRNVSEYEPRVETVEAEAEAGPGQGEVTVRVTYVIKGEANERTLTFPLFVGPSVTGNSQ